MKISKTKTTFVHLWRVSSVHQTQITVNQQIKRGSHMIAMFAECDSCFSLLFPWVLTQFKKSIVSCRVRDPINLRQFFAIYKICVEKKNGRGWGAEGYNFTCTIEVFGWKSSTNTELFWANRRLLFHAFLTTLPHTGNKENSLYFLNIVLKLINNL